DLNRMPVARTTTGPNAKAGTGLSWGGTAASATESAPGCFRNVFVTWFVVSTLVHSFPLLDVRRIGMQELAQGRWGAEPT
ncbi:MAG TPA: hypothetical protein VKT80_12735, partial [Chloroflexota bacterium]|nr:hypothetical protein [Chloroflexota bacterium]